LVSLATLPGTEYEALAFGDTDHDGLGEVVHYDGDAQGVHHYYLYEHRGANTYSLEFVGDDLIPYAIGDLDRDGKTELVGQFGSQIRVYESIDPNSYPTELVWVSPNISNVVGYSIIGDTDLDGRQEIIHSANSFGGSSGLLIYENDGDNSFALVYTAPFQGGSIGEKAIGDLDSDGLPEIAFSNLGGHVYVLASTMDNTWMLKWTTTTIVQAAYAVEIGPDLDGNGKPELFVLGNRQGWRTFIYEVSGVDQFAQVGSLVHNDGFGGHPFNAIGNLTGGGQLYYLMEGSCCAWVYTATGPGLWALASTLMDDMHGGLYTIDLNGNGRSEVFWAGDGSARVLEHRGSVSDGWEAPVVLAGLQISPNPVRTGASIVLRGTATAGERLCLYNAAGRRLQEWRVSPNVRSIPWVPMGMSPGVYFVQLQRRDGTPLAQSRVTLVR
jgi:hypothetical protein